ncbi:tetratricopeptide repeat protein [Amycolatopsis alkalitolerans]|uniref:Helix-turn-helix transcriptional regulator n=1 Tax=Amycolatopsis alkalitolerans TaxID=2547244 RepID=A0A5C4M3H8_9PSEU|nr:tetratricopeptide repeat protein [Amycolatopsis alkalitolerans]TNC25479.1 helix-turn-helix transcriptional regulator [Amycolatopsis alkalitolerans]
MNRANGDQTDQEASAFGRLLLRHRRAARLTQAQLAAASGVSVRAVRDLERGRAQAAQQRSAAALADAMGLAREDRAEFLAAARDGRRRVPKADDDLSCRLPPAVPDLLGRDTELERLCKAAAAESPSGVVLSIIGHPGVGKTALAVAAAHALADRYPDGCFALDLRGMDEQPVGSRAALEQLLRALGVPAQQIPPAGVEQQHLFRSLLVGRRVLLLLDNAADEAQVRPLLAASPGCLTLITCRRALAGLETGQWVWLEPLDSAGATGLLATIAGAGRVGAEPEAAAELVALCGYLPLAVRIAGNRLATRPGWSIAYLVSQLRDVSTRLGSLAAGDLQVRSAFELSYRRLSPSARRVFRRLAAIPGADFAAGLAAVATAVSEAEVQPYLEELADANLVQVATSPGRYRFHDLIRIFAAERLDAEEQPRDSGRLADATRRHLLGTASAAARAFAPDVRDPRPFASRRDAAAWLDAEATNWLAAHRAAAAAGHHREVLELARAMHWYSGGRTQHRPWFEIFSLGVTAARALGSRRDEAAMLDFAGWARYFCLADNEGGLAAHSEALRIATETGDRREQAWAQAYLASVLMRLGRLDDALGHARGAVELARELEFWLGQGTIRNTLGAILRTLGRVDEALAVHWAVLSDVEARYGEANPEARRLFRASTLLDIGLDLNDADRWPRAANTFREARALFRQGGFRLEEAHAALNEGRARREVGQHAFAGVCLQLALTAFTGVPLRWPRARTLAELSTLRLATGDLEAAGDYRRQALALCDELGTGEARALAAGLARDRSTVDG